MSVESIQSERVAGAVAELTEAIRAWAADPAACAIVGVANGGIELARHLHRSCCPQARFGIINAAFHRDDIHIQPIPKNFTPTDIDFDIDGLRVMIVDDVFSSGRTARAVMNEIFDHGRPASIALAVLADTGRRILPIHPDICPLHLSPPPGARAIVTFDAAHPESAAVHIQSVP